MREICLFLHSLTTAKIGEMGYFLSKINVSCFTAHNKYSLRKRGRVIFSKSWNDPVGNLDFVELMKITPHHLFTLLALTTAQILNRIAPYFLNKSYVCFTIGTLDKYHLNYNYNRNVLRSCTSVIRVINLTARFVYWCLHIILHPNKSMAGCLLPFDLFYFFPYLVLIEFDTGVL